MPEKSRYLNPGVVCWLHNNVRLFVRIARAVVHKADEVAAFWSKLAQVP